MLHYTDCGLENIYLANGYQVMETPYGRAVSVENARELHQRIGCDLVNGVPHLSGRQFRFLRAVMDMTQAELARPFGNDVQTIARWEKLSRVPKLANQLIRQIYLEHVGEKPSYTETVERVLSLPAAKARLQYRDAGAGLWQQDSAAA